MSRKGNPWDNAACESFMKTLKYEEVLSQRIPRPGRGARFDPRVPGKDLQPEAAALGAGLPAAGRVRTKPADQQQGGRCAAAFFMSFPRHREIYPSDGGAKPNAADAPAHRLDEFPAGYSLAGCSPAEPASASPAGHQYAVQSSCRSRIFQRTANSVLTVCVSRGGKRNPVRWRDAYRLFSAGERYRDKRLSPGCWSWLLITRECRRVTGVSLVDV